jgi:hypothetical protein
MGLGGYVKQKKMYRVNKQIFFTGAIDHAPQIFLRAFSHAGAIAPVS